MPGPQGDSGTDMLTRRSISAGLAATALAGGGAARTHATFPVWPKRARAAVSLTYDDGLASQLDNAVGPLGAVGLKATFFVTRDNAEPRVKDWARLARAGGHEFGNHTVTHPCDL